LLQAFFAKVLTAPAPGGFVQLYADGVISPGDKLVYEIDPKTQALNRVLFHATLDGDPIDATVELANVPGGGPNYAARTTVTAPAKKLTEKIEDVDDGARSMTVHLVNPSHLSFGVGAITPDGCSSSPARRQLRTAFRALRTKH
jgi:hypothetical protein